MNRGLDRGTVVEVKCLFKEIRAVTELSPIMAGNGTLMAMQSCRARCSSTSSQ